MMWEDDREVPEYRYVYTPEAAPMPKPVYIFLVIVAVLMILAAVGFLSGRWEVLSP